MPRAPAPGRPQARPLPSPSDAVSIDTCTGYLCPALSSHVVERLGLRTDVKTLDLFGQGCGAALPNPQRAVRHAALIGAPTGPRVSTSAYPAPRVHRVA